MLLLLLTANAQDPADQAAALPVGAVGEPGLIVVVGDPDSQAGGALSGQVTDDGVRRSFVLSDDGTPPDAIAGDGTHTAHIPLTQHGGQSVVVISADDAVLWTDIVPLGATRADPTLKILLQADHALAAVDTSDTARPPAEPPPRGVPAADALPPAAEGRRDEPATGSVILVGLIALIAGLLLGRAWARRGAPLPLASVGGDPTPTVLVVGGLQQTEVLPDDDARTMRLIALASTLAEAGPVLVVPREVSRPALSQALSEVGGVRWLTTPRPLTEHILAAAALLAHAGRPVVLIEGAGALEPHAEDEPPGALLAELLEDATVDVVVLVTAAEAAG